VVLFFTFFKYIYISRLWVRKKNPKKYPSLPRFYCVYIYVCVRRTYTCTYKRSPIFRTIVVRAHCAVYCTCICDARIHIYLTYTVFTSGFYLRSHSLVYITVAVFYTYKRSEIVLEITATDTEVHDDYTISQNNIICKKGFSLYIHAPTQIFISRTKTY